MWGQEAPPPMVSYPELMAGFPCGDLGKSKIIITSHTLYNYFDSFYTLSHLATITNEWPGVATTVTT